ELRPGADPIGKRGEPGPIFDLMRRFGADPCAAAAIVEGADQLAVAHLPPLMVRVNCPCSGKSGLFSTRAISSVSSWMNPVATASLNGNPWRWNLVTVTESTPSTPWAAA